MRIVEFLDTSLRDGEQTPGVNFSIKEKLATARQLEKWGISAIEAGFPAASPDSFAAVQEIAKVLKKTAVTGLARSVKSDIDACYEVLKNAKYPQVHVFIATSPIHRKYKLNKSKEEILEAIKDHVSYARSKFEVVEFSPEDATRTELDFLLQVVQTAVDAGASYINIPDTVGFTTPEEYGAIFKHLIENVKTDRQIIYSPHCHDDLGMEWLTAFLLSRMVQDVSKELLMALVSELEMLRLKKLQWPSIFAKITTKSRQALF